jgi:hypothetical protein
MNWRDHPFAIAVITCVGTLTVISTLVSQFIIPTWLQSKDNQIILQKTQIENLEAKLQQLQHRLEDEPKKLKADVERLSGDLQMSEAENLKLRHDLDSLDPDSLFSADNVYPRGFRGVRIGDRLDMIAKIYSNDADLEENAPLWIEVRFKKPQLFSQVVYYYSDFATRTKSDTVLFVFFLFQDTKTGYDLVKNGLVEKYGERTMKVEKQKKDTVLVWPDVLGYRLELGAGGYTIRRK